ncbi:MAG: ChbG/HpnK family deacetylase [bacterium]|nr:ChbG/HpnK family deacetylase [bacterium]
MIKESAFALLVVAVLLGYAPWCAAADKTFAERLGWEPDARVVIFHCDDAGMSHSSNTGAIEALEGGVLTSVSTMMPCSWVPEFAAYLKEHPEMDNGIHATFTSEWKHYRWAPVAGRGATPGLVDETGFMWHNVIQVATHATPDDIERELRAQVALAEQLGMPITHIDTHMGTVYATEEFLARYIKVGAEKGIPVMIPGGHMTLLEQARPGSIARMQQSGLGEQVWQAGLPVLDDLAGGIKGPHPREQMADNAIHMLKNLKPGITQIIVHCTRPTETFPAISSSGSNRLRELETMLDPRVKQCIEDEGVILTTWRELKERRDKVGP